MKHLVPLLSMMLLTGCAVSLRQAEVAKGRRTFSAMQAAVTAAGNTAKDAVVLVKYRDTNSSSGRIVIVGQGGSGRSRPGSKSVNGIVLTTNGYAVVAKSLEPDKVERLEVWVGEVEYPAKIMKHDDQLDMTVIKIDADEPLAALDIREAGDLLVGDWCVGVQPSDEDYDYEHFFSLAVCRGLIDGRYRTFLLDDAPLIKEGTPVVGLDGRIAGIVHKRGHVLSMNDLREDLLDLISDAQGASSSDDESKKNAWFGALLQPINAEYARKYHLDKGSLWVQHVIADGPAALAGVENGDLIVQVDNREMRFSGNRAREYFMNTLRPREGEPFSVTVLRDGEKVVCEGTFSKRPEDQTLRADDLGVTVKEIMPGSVVMNNLFSSEGVYITEVKKGSAAAVGSNMRSSLLEKGDIILSLANEPTPDLESFSKVLEKLRRERPAVVLVSFLRGRTTGIAALNLLLGDSDDEQENDNGDDA